MKNIIENQPFHITVGATPQSSLAPDLTHEIRLLKAALLYADKVKFCSPTYQILQVVMSLGQMKGEELIRLFAQATENYDLIRVYKTYKTLRSKKNSKSHSQYLATYVKMETLIRKAEKDAKKYALDLVKNAGLDALESAVRTGLVEVQFLEGENTDQITNSYFNAVADAILSGKTYPLFDDTTGNLVDLAVKEGKFLPSVSAIKRSTQVGLSSDLFNRLPLFDNASIDEIIGIRKELSKPLIRFRSALVRFSREIECASWDQDFPKESEEVFRQYVEPAVLEIEEMCKSNKFLLTLIPKFVDKNVIIASSIFGLLVAQASSLPSIIPIGLGLTAGIALTTYESVKEWQEKNSQIEKNQLFFYYKAGQQLSR